MKAHTGLALGLLAIATVYLCVCLFFRPAVNVGEPTHDDTSAWPGGASPATATVPLSGGDEFPDKRRDRTAIAPEAVDPRGVGDPAALERVRRFLEATARIDILSAIGTYYPDPEVLAVIARAVRDGALQASDVLVALTTNELPLPSWRRNILILAWGFTDEFQDDHRRFTFDRIMQTAVAASPSSDMTDEALCSAHCLQIRGQLASIREAVIKMVETAPSTHGALEGDKGMIADMYFRSAALAGDALPADIALRALAMQSLRASNRSGAAAIAMRQDELGIVSRQLGSSVVGSPDAHYLAFIRMESSVAPVALILAEKCTRPGSKAFALAGLLGMGSRAGIEAATPALANLSGQDWTDVQTSWDVLPPERMASVACGLAAAASQSAAGEAALVTVIDTLRHRLSPLRIPARDRAFILESMLASVNGTRSVSAARTALQLAAQFAGIEDIEAVRALGVGPDTFADVDAAIQCIRSRGR